MSTKTDLAKEIINKKSPFYAKKRKFFFGSTEISEILIETEEEAAHGGHPGGIPSEYQGGRAQEGRRQGGENVDRQYCTVRNVNILGEAEHAYVFRGAKVKKLNLEVRVHNNLQDGTEV